MRVAVMSWPVRAMNLGSARGAEVPLLYGEGRESNSTRPCLKNNETFPAQPMSGWKAEGLARIRKVHSTPVLAGTVN